MRKGLMVFPQDLEIDTDSERFAHRFGRHFSSQQLWSVCTVAAAVRATNRRGKQRFQSLARTDATLFLAKVAARQRVSGVATV